MVDMFDERYFSEDESIDWKSIKVGDIVLEGDITYEYRILTNIDGYYWEYFGENDGYYHSTSPEHCHWKVEGQKGCKGKLIKINHDQ